MHWGHAVSKDFRPLGIFASGHWPPSDEYDDYQKGWMFFPAVRIEHEGKFICNFIPATANHGNGSGAMPVSLL